MPWGWEIRWTQVDAVGSSTESKLAVGGVLRRRVVALSPLAGWYHGTSSRITEGVASVVVFLLDTPTVSGSGRYLRSADRR